MGMPPRIEDEHWCYFGNRVFKMDLVITTEGRLETPGLAVRGEGVGGLRGIMGKTKLQPILSQRFWLEEGAQKG
jgi:hypothetical protein